ncbi:A/G-specific adenine glycosylase [Treponema primitia]|uniref:helix-turn-helix domain-containing protein n=1 Tax=Treponema primitia TaxID=88058 RepID=UPI00398113EF
MDRTEFRNIIYTNFKKAGRVFPWRQDTDPWGVLVSEFMLQQTQTDRVIPYWERWMKLWPKPGDLAKASLEEVLREWSGLGYNRRARYLKECAACITAEYRGKVPDTPEGLLPLPGIGAYTAGAISCFAYNYPAVFIETNIRATVIHFYFQERLKALDNKISDAEIFPILESVLDKRNPRKWYWALMDYGAALKKITPNPNRRSAHYTRQSPFEGSFRQVRGRLIRTLVSEGPASAKELRKRTGIEKTDLYKALEALQKESMVAEEDGVYRIGAI